MNSEYVIIGAGKRKFGDRSNAGARLVASAYGLRPHNKNLEALNLAEAGSGAEMGGIGAEYRKTGWKDLRSEFGEEREAE